MSQNSILLEKSLVFAARTIKLHKYLVKEKKANNFKSNRTKCYINRSKCE